MSFISWVMLMSAMFILVRAVFLAAHLSIKNWRGHPFRFAGVAAANSFLAAGAVGIVLGWHQGVSLLLIGAALKMASDRKDGHA